MVSLFGLEYFIDIKSVLRTLNISNLKKFSMTENKYKNYYVGFIHVLKLIDPY